MTFGNDWGFGNNFEESKKIFDAYRSKGGNFFDTACNYTNGTSERYLGEYMNGIRSEVVLATKFTANANSTAALGGPKSSFANPNAGGNHRKSLVETLDASLKRLNVLAVDILYVHFWEFSTPVEEVMRNLNDVVSSGKAYHVAISDTPAWLISKANTLSSLRGWSPFVGIQTRYNLLDRSYEFDLGPMAQNLGLGTIPWGALAEGYLTGKHSEKAEASSGRKDAVNRHINDPRNQKILEQVKTIAKETGATPGNVSLNWLLQRPTIASPLIGARNVEQLEQNLKCLDFKLSKDQLESLNNVSAPSFVPFPNSGVGRLSAFADGGAKIQRKMPPFMM